MLTIDWRSPTAYEPVQNLDAVQAIGERLMAEQADIHGFTVKRPAALGYISGTSRSSTSIHNICRARQPRMSGSAAGTRVYCSTAIPVPCDTWTCPPANIAAIR